MSLCVLIFLALVNKVSENTKQRNLFSKKVTLCITLFFVLGGPIVAHIFSSHYESYDLHIAELTNENGQGDLESLICYHNDFHVVNLAFG